MNKKIYSAALLLFIYVWSFAQADYKIGTKNKDGYTTIYNTVYITDAAYYSKTSSVTRYGLMEEKTGKIILPMKYATVYTAYEDGLYIVLDTLNNYGLYSATAKKMIVEPQYNGFQPFSEGVAVVQKKAFVNGWSEYTYGAVDKSGKLVIDVTYPYLGNCRDGMISFKKDDKYGFIDKKGSLKIPATYYRAENFANGLAPVQATENDKYGYINTDNKFVIEPQYVEAASFYEGYASVYTEKKFYSYKNSTGSDNQR